MLRNNELQSPYLLARAAAAIFDTVDVDESGELDEVSEGEGEGERGEGEGELDEVHVLV